MAHPVPPPPANPAHRANPATPAVALTIAGSDSSGGAGIQADLKTFAVFRCFGTSAVTAITAQNTTGVRAATLLEPELIGQQIAAVADDLPVAAVKTGMLGSAAIITAVAAALDQHRLPAPVVDPVMIAKSGASLIDDEAIQALIEQLIPRAALVTPNKHEAARLTDPSQPVTTVDAASRAAEQICRDYGAAACIVKGIRREHAGREESVDVVFDGRQVRELTGPWHPGTNTHGSGCAFSAAVAALLARGRGLDDALATAKRFIDAAIGHDLRLGHGHAPVDPLAWLER